MANPLRQRLGALLARPPPTSSPLLRNAVSKRFLATQAHPHDDAEETEKWRNITIAAYIVCITLGAYTLANEEHHEQHERPEYSYLHIRNKEFSWGEDGLFEFKHKDEEH